MRKLVLSDELALPLDIITRRTCTYGDSGAGKTTLGRLLAEQIHAAKQRFGAIDLKNDWWGFKSSQDGKSAGIPVLVFGGPRADVKIFDDAHGGGGAGGAALADIVASIEQSFVIDLDAMSRMKQERFLAAFLDRLYEVNRKPLMMFMDECDRYAPQKPMTSDAIMSLSSAEDIARRGRKRGIGSFWITQRTSVLNKNVSELQNMAVIFRTPGSIDLHELKDRVGRVADKKTVDEVIKLAPGLEDGQAFFLSSHPKLRGYMPNPVRPIQLPMPWTFDSSATPGIGQRRREPKVLAEADLASIQDKIAKQVERAKSEDPRELQRKVKDLENTNRQLTHETEQLRNKNEALANKTGPIQHKRVEVAVVREIEIKRIESAGNELGERLVKYQQGVTEAIGSVRQRIEDLNASLATPSAPAQRAFEKIKDIAADLKRVQASVGGGGPVVQTAPQISPAPGPVIPAPVMRFGLVTPTVPKSSPPAAAASKEPSAAGDTSAGGGLLGRGERAMLIVLAQRRGSILGAKQIAAWTGLAVRTVQNNIKTLRGAGLVVGSAAEGLSIGNAGLAALGEYTPLPTGRALIDHYLGTLAAGESAVLKTLVGVHPGSLSSEQIAMHTGLAVRTVQNNLKALRTRQLVVGGSGNAKASEDLFKE